MYILQTEVLKMYTLPEERKKLSQSRARLQRDEILLKLKESKARISNFIRIGEIMERCRISTVDHKVLAGGFLFMNESLKDPKQASQWAARGEPYVQKPLPPKKEPRLLQVVFSALPPEEIRKSLWARGFTCETTNHLWEGKGTKKELEGIVGHYGSVYRVKEKLS